MRNLKASFFPFCVSQTSDSCIPPSQASMSMSRLCYYVLNISSLNQDTFKKLNRCILEGTCYHYVNGN